MFRSFFSAALRLCGLIFLFAAGAAAQVPAPKDVLGFTPGDDRKLASWAQVVDYFQKLDKASDRVKFEEIGKSTMGAPFVYATISSPANLKALAKYNDINKKLADPRKIAGTRATLPARDAAAKGLIAQGKTIVLITYGIHSTEVGSYLSSMLVAHQLASSDDARTKGILDNTIILLVPALNPDGVDIVKNWYDKTLGTPYEGTNPPELYHKYVGHDLNRDWYAFTQVETQLTVDKIHNVWRPQIVLDVHQQGIYGARQFVPPYMPPVEPNVPKQIVEGFTELGSYIANDLRKNGFQGITTGTTYDAWTPARAYSHYHGGVRILSETASARLATPVEVKFEQLGTSPGGLDAKVESPNFGPVWKGGTWKLRNITDYMTATAFSLLTHAANNREKWLSRFYEIGKEAVRPRKDGQMTGFLIPYLKPSGSDELTEAHFRRQELLTLLRRAGVEAKTMRSLKLGEIQYPDGTVFIPLDQPYGGFAKALLENQTYPNLLDDNGNPVRPYDVTAHTLPMLFDVEVVPIFKNFDVKGLSASLGIDRGCVVGGRRGTPSNAIYRSASDSMDEGWTRWVFEQRTKAKCDADYRSITDKDIRSGGDLGSYIVFPDQPANQILNGYAKGAMPDEYVGGLGREGVENLKTFVEAGGTLVFLNRSSLFAIEQFNLPIRNVTAGLDRKDFYIPGSILRTELDTNHPIAKGMTAQSIAWFENSPAFELSEPPAVAGGLVRPVNNDGSITQLQPPATAGGTDKKVRVIARYPSDPKNILLSGWALGAEKIAGKAALVEVTMGKGKIILFGFRPQYRGQSLATFPLLFNAISQ
ncbi:MAG: hypothetical protein KF881_04735 [Acidobacteria bacterium]|nr:hypothetical protein [Acidobacteriota bacterium]